MESTEYLKNVFKMMKQVQGISLGDFRSHFNNSEMRLIEEISLAKAEDEKLISTQLAKLLGVTRSAISQMVNKLELAGIVKRTPDKVDRKIAYIELTDEAEAIYAKERQIYSETLNKVIEKIGIEKFEELTALAEEFSDVVQDVTRR
ncbi:MAG: MarR family transcriptional regulator [Clostridia bacterium]|nr:MarR family transcriptional regulator [Clostridia bacterium]